MAPARTRFASTIVLAPPVVPARALVSKPILGVVLLPEAVPSAFRVTFEP